MTYTIIIIVAYLMGSTVPVPYVEVVTVSTQCSAAFVRAYTQDKSNALGEKFQDNIQWQCMELPGTSEEEKPAPKKDAA